MTNSSSLSRTESTGSRKRKGSASLGMFCFCGKVRAIEISVRSRMHSLNKILFKYTCIFDFTSGNVKISF